MIPHSAKIRAAGGGPLLPVSFIAAWDRADQPAEPVGGSSGPKDYVKNAVWSVFSSQLDVRRVLFVRSAGALFLLLLKPEGWFDIAGAPVVIEEGAASYAA